MTTIYFDENMPPHLARAFNSIQRAEGLKTNYPTVQVVHFNDTDFKGVTDIDWIPKMAETKSFVVTKDIHQSKRKDEFEAYKKAGLGVFILRGKSKKENINVWETLTILSKHWYEILDHISNTKRPFMIEVSSNRKPKLYKI